MCGITVYIRRLIRVINSLTSIVDSRELFSARGASEAVDARLYPCGWLFSNKEGQSDSQETVTI